MSNNFVEKLYDISNTSDDNGMSKFDEQKLRKYLDGNNKLARRNADVFKKEEPKYSTCHRYLPCPICDKCLNKASHLYISCQTCKIPICVHTYGQRVKMIRRENFKIEVNNEVKKKLLELSAKFPSKSL